MYTPKPTATIDTQQLIAGFYRSGHTRGSLVEDWPRQRRPMPYAVALVIVVGGLLIGAAVTL